MYCKSFYGTQPLRLTRPEVVQSTVCLENTKELIGVVMVVVWWGVGGMRGGGGSKGGGGVKGGVVGRC